MNNPQERIIKKMIDNIVETNRPVFEKGAPTAESQATTFSSSSNSSSEEITVVARKIEYGFNTMRQENAELRKMLEELGGVVKMLRNDMDSLRMTIQQTARASATPAHHEAPQMRAPQQSGSMGAPQYRKSEADEAYERDSGQEAHAEGTPQVQQARGFAKKEDKGETIDISKVFYYGKK